MEVESPKTHKCRVNVIYTKNNQFSKNNEHVMKMLNGQIQHINIKCTYMCRVSMKSGHSMMSMKSEHMQKIGKNIIILKMLLQLKNISKKVQDIFTYFYLDLN